MEEICGAERGSDVEVIADCGLRIACEEPPVRRVARNPQSAFRNRL